VDKSIKNEYLSIFTKRKMKTRLSFVTNSSSSSFLITNLSKEEKSIC